MSLWFVWFGVILYLGAIKRILMWSFRLGWWYFSVNKFLFMHVDFDFYTCIYKVLHMDKKNVSVVL